MADRLSFSIPAADTPAAPPIGANFGKAIVDSVPLDQIRPFPNHPFKVLDNADMQQLVESICDHGVQEPVMLRPMNGEYQLLSGHRRCHASKLAGLATIPAIVRTMTDDEATIYMVDANLHRPYILPSEKARAYRMKMDALRHQGKKADGSEQGDTAGETWSANQIAKDAGVSSRQVYRYIRLADLIDPFLEMIDNKEQKVQPNPSDHVFTMPMKIGLILAVLTDEQQHIVYTGICETGTVPDATQAYRLQALGQNGTLTRKSVISFLKPQETPLAQSFVDAVLLSWYSARLEKRYTTEPKTEFVKSVTREYRHRGSSYPIQDIWTEIQGKADGLYLHAQKQDMRLTWTKVAARIGELIEQGRYTNADDKTKETSAPTTESSVEDKTTVLCDAVSQRESKPETLIRLRNKQEREAFLENYERWGVWKEIPELRVRFYKYDLPNGARIVVQTYVHPPISYFSYMQEEYTVAEYALLLPDEDDYRGTYHQEYTFYRPNGASKSTLIDYLSKRKPLVRDFSTLINTKP